jgi:cytochrome c-type biogenesis protein CcmE
MEPRKRFILAAFIVVASIGGLVAWALTSSTAYYRTPEELLAQPTDPTQRIRVAGTVVEGSVTRAGETTRFSVSDGGAAIEVTTNDVLPDTFAGGVEAVAEGAMTAEGNFVASTVLAKCPSKFKARIDG